MPVMGFVLISALNLVVVMEKDTVCLINFYNFYYTSFILMFKNYKKENNNFALFFKY